MDEIYLVRERERSSHKKRSPLGISRPTNFTHHVHVDFDQNSGVFTGLPKVFFFIFAHRQEWEHLLQSSTITREEMQKDPQAVLDVLEFYSENLLDVQEEYDVDTPTSPYDRIPAHSPTSLSYHGTTEGLREFRRDSARKIPTNTSDLVPFVYGGQQSRQYQRISPLLTEKEKSSSFERRVVDPTLERESSQDSRISPIENRTSPMERRDRRISPRQQPPLSS